MHSQCPSRTLTLVTQCCSSTMLSGPTLSGCVMRIRYITARKVNLVPIGRSRSLTTLWKSKRIMKYFHPKWAASPSSSACLILRHQASFRWTLLNTIFSAKQSLVLSHRPTSHCYNPLSESGPRRFWTNCQSGKHLTG